MGPKNRKTYQTVFIWIAMCATTLGLTVNTVAQTVSPTPPEEDEVIKVNSRLVVVPVSVIDGNGEPVVGLRAENFHIREENRAQVIESVGDAENVPLEIALLFDVSASTDSMFRFQQETAAKFLRDVLRPDDRATIFTIGQKGVLVRARETAEAAMETIRAIEPTKEQTAFYDAVRMAANFLERETPAGRRKVILMISDGEDTNSEGVLKAIWEAERKVADNIAGSRLRELRVKARDTAKVVEQMKVLKALQDADAVVYAINPGGSSIELNRMAVFGQENMQKFADDTGGTAFVPRFLPAESPNEHQNLINIRRNEEMLARIFRQVANELRAQYLVQYYSGSEFPANRFVRLEVGLAKQEGLKVRARQGYFVKN